MNPFIYLGFVFSMLTTVALIIATRHKFQEDKSIALYWALMLFLNLALFWFR